MNAISALSICDSDKMAWDQACQAVNAWRGQLIHVFTLGEAAVSETLTILAQAGMNESNVPLRHLLGQRLEDLNTALATCSQFETESNRAAVALTAFRQHETLRPLLCHGVAKVWLERNGHWAVALDLLAFRAGKPDRSSLFLEQRKAEALSKEVGRHCRRMVASLSTLREVILGHT